MSVEIEYDNGTPVAISWALGDNPIAFLVSEHEERYEIDLRHLLSFDGERTAPIKPRAPFVGMGCTITLATDREAATVIEVGDKRIRVQVDRSERTDENGMSECQSYSYTRDPGGEVYTFVRKRSGAWVSVGGSKTLTLGVRRSYHDYSY